MSTERGKLKREEKTQAVLPRRRSCLSEFEGAWSHVCGVEILRRKFAVHLVHEGSGKRGVAWGEAERLLPLSSAGPYRSSAGPRRRSAGGL